MHGLPRCWLHFGNGERRSEGVFFAARSFIAKSVHGIGVMTATVLLTVIQFPQDAQPGAVDPAVIVRLGVVYAPALLTLYLISVAWIAAYRISRDSHAENLRQLAGTDGQS